MNRRRTRPAELGALAEELAARHLVGLGWRLVERNLRLREAELDLVLWDGDVLVAVEVKGRSRSPTPERAVDAARQERLRRALRALAREQPAARLRVDVVAVRLLPDEPADLLHLRGRPFDA
jgi:putative endonuclease